MLWASDHMCPQYCPCNSLFKSKISPMLITYGSILASKSMLQGQLRRDYYLNGSTFY